MSDRTYLKRAAGMLWEGKAIEVSLYMSEQRGVADVDGVYEGKSFDSLRELAVLAGWDKAEADRFSARLQAVIVT